MAQQKNDTPQGTEVEQLRSAAERVSSAARTGAQTGADATRESGQLLGRTAQESGQAAQRSIQAGGEVTRRGLEDIGQGAQQLAEAGADQLERMGEMLADAARNTAESARMMMTFSNFTNEGVRNLQQATSGLFERLIQTNVQAMQEFTQQANPGGVLSIQQRFIREYLQALTLGGAELVRAAQQLASEAARPLEEQARSNGGRARQQRSRKGRIADVMSADIRTIRPDDTVQQAAQLMSNDDTGVLPVTDEESRVVGMITDRDIAIRLASTAKDPAKTRVREIMSQEIQYCYEDEDVQHVADLMADEQLHRLPVMDRRQHLVGIVSIGDVSKRKSPQMAGQALAGIARKSEQHSQRPQG